MTAQTQTLAELEERLARKERELAAVHRISCALCEQPGLDHLIQQGLLTAIEVMDGSAGSILLYDPRDRTLVFRYVVGATDEITKQLTGQRIDAGKGIAGAVFQSGRGVITQDVRTDKRHFHGIDEATTYETRDMITVALRGLGGARLGVMEILNHRGRPFTDADLEVLEIIAGQAAMALETAALHEKALSAEAEQKRFSHDVLRVVTKGKLQLVDAEDVPDEGELIAELSLEDAGGYRQARQDIQAAAEEAGLNEDAAGDLVLAAGEAITNAIKHAVGGRCAIRRSAERLLVRVSDRGEGIDSEDLPETLLLPGFSTKVSLGMGYEMIFKLVDVVWLATGPEGTVLQLGKWLRPEEHPEPSALDEALARMG